MIDDTVLFESCGGLEGEDGLGCFSGKYPVGNESAVGVVAECEECLFELEYVGAGGWFE